MGKSGEKLGGKPRIKTWCENWIKTWWETLHKTWCENLDPARLQDLNQTQALLTR